MMLVSRRTPSEASRRGLVVAVAVFAAMFPTALSGQVLGIQVTFASVPGGVSLGGAGTGSATLALGTVSAFGALQSGVARTLTSSDYTLSTPFGIRVSKDLLLLSSSYTLQSRLQTASSLSWTLDGVAMTTTYATLATNEPYATTRSHSLAFVVPFSRPAGVMSAAFDVLAIAN